MSIKTYPENVFQNQYLLQLANENRLQNDPLSEEREKLDYYKESYNQPNDGPLDQTKNFYKNYNMQTIEITSGENLNIMNNIRYNDEDKIKIFWKDETSWDKRKEIAKDYIDYLINNNYNNHINVLAYNCNLEEIKKLLETDKKDEDSKNQIKKNIDEYFHKKDNFELSPLIYAIWGENYYGYEDYKRADIF